MPDAFFLVRMAILSYFQRQNPGYLQGRLLFEKKLSFSFKGRVELLIYVYFCAQQSIIKAGNNKFKDLINAPRMSNNYMEGSGSATIK